MNIDYKGAKVLRDDCKHIDWSNEVNCQTVGWIGEDLLCLKYDTCMIDMGWYGGIDGAFRIIVVVPEANGEYEEVSWNYPYANIACKDQHDMFEQLQRAIDIYPKMCEHLP